MTSPSLDSIRPFSRSAKTLATAAATIPRGASRARNAFSFSVSVLRKVDSQTAAGRTTTIRNTQNNAPRKPSAVIWSIDTRALSRMNSVLISRTVSTSLNSKMWRISARFWLVMASPITVTATSPDSCANVPESVLAARTLTNVTGLCRWSGTW